MGCQVRARGKTVRHPNEQQARNAVVAVGTLPAATSERKIHFAGAQFRREIAAKAFLHG
jgi:hypothetical protein